MEDAKSKAIFCDGMIKFQLVKKNPVQWNNLQVAELVDKEFMKRKREEAIMKVHKRSENELAQKAEEKRKQERIALREQMKVMKLLIIVTTVEILVFSRSVIFMKDSDLFQKQIILIRL